MIIYGEVLISELIKNYLVSFYFSEIFLAHTKKQAIQLINYVNTDLILLDLHLQMPKDGIDITKFIDKRGGPSYIFITANATNSLYRKPYKQKQ